MVDGLGYDPGTAEKVLTDDTGAGGHAQVVKLAYGADGVATQAQLDADGLLVNLGANNDVTTELPAAAAMTSGMAAVAVPRVGAKLLGSYGPGDTEFRIGVVGGEQDSLASGSAIQYLMSVASFQYPFNGTNHDRFRNNMYESALLAAAARTATVASADQTNYNARGVLITIYVSSYGGGNIIPYIETYSTPGGGWTQILVGPTITATGMYQLVLYPGSAKAVPSTIVAGAVSDWPLPRNWRLNCVHSTSDSNSYGADAYLIV